MKNINGPLKVGIGGPVGAGKTSLTAELCKFLSKKISMAVISNDIYTKEDAEFLMKVQCNIKRYLHKRGCRIFNESPSFTS